MSRTIVTRIHAATASLALVTIAAFWTSSLTVELVGAPSDVATVRRAILWGLAILVPALAVAGATGMRLGGKATSGRALAKKRRMPVIAGNGVLVLVPCAVTLDTLAATGDLGTLFHALQGVELVAGALNIALLSLNMRDGLAMTGRIRPAKQAARG